MHHSLVFNFEQEVFFLTYITARGHSTIQNVDATFWMVEIAENRCRLNNKLCIPAAVSHFAVGWTEEHKDPSPVEAVPSWPYDATASS